MTAHADGTRARRYLLGDSSELERAIVEHDYFENEAALDRMSAAEEDLIEDYLSNELSPGERHRFERNYLSAPHHRVRVETTRRLRARASQARPAAARVSAFPPRFTRARQYLALAASLLVLASASLWLSSSSTGRQAAIAGRRAPAPSEFVAPDRAPRPAPDVSRIFAVTVSPVSVRSVAESVNVVVPAGIDVVAIHLEGTGESGAFTPTRASIQTVGGGEVWNGRVLPDAALPAGSVARIDVQAASLPADDYIVTLFATDAGRVEREWAHYFLRVRNR